jgi:hypothetical protein
MQLTGKKTVGPRQAHQPKTLSGDLDRCLGLPSRPDAETERGTVLVAGVLSRIENALVTDCRVHLWKQWKPAKQQPHWTLPPADIDRGARREASIDYVHSPGCKRDS